MELKDDLRGKRIYFDTGIFAYLLGGFEDSEPLNDLKDLISKKEIEVFTSNKVYAQIIQDCDSDEDNEHAESFLHTFNPSGKESRELMTTYREVSKMSQSRSTHVLSAIENDCDIFLTDDFEMIVPDCLELVLFSDYRNDELPLYA